MKPARALRVAGAPVHSLYDATLALLHAVRLPAHASDADVHEARKQMKRIRAALRLLRPALGAGAYRSANRRVRDAAKLLAPIRDAQSLLTTVEALKQRSRGGRGADLYLHRLKEQLLTARAASRARLTGRFSRESSSLLRGAAALLRKMPAKRREPLSAIQGLRRVYREGRRALKRVRRRPTDQAFHEWRKQTKYLANQATLVSLPYRLKVKGLKRRAEKLAQTLGARHDLDVALAKLQDTPTRRRLGPLPGGIAKSINKRRKKLARRAYVLGRRVYREKPLKFAKRLERNFRP
jgi:CHAD domain-containing protein